MKTSKIDKPGKVYVVIITTTTTTTTTTTMITIYYNNNNNIQVTKQTKAGSVGTKDAKNVRTTQ